MYINKTLEENPDIIDVIAICGGYDKGLEVFYKCKMNDPEIDELFKD